MNKIDKAPYIRVKISAVILKMMIAANNSSPEFILHPILIILLAVYVALHFCVMMT